MSCHHPSDSSPILLVGAIAKGYRGLSTPNPTRPGLRREDDLTLVNLGEMWMLLVVSYHQATCAPESGISPTAMNRSLHVKTCFASSDTWGRPVPQFGRARRNATYVALDYVSLISLAKLKHVSIIKGVYKHHQRKISCSLVIECTKTFLRPISTVIYP